MRFDNERSQAMTEMNGVYCSSRPMRIGAVTHRKSSGYQHGKLFFNLLSHCILYLIVCMSI